MSFIKYFVTYIKISVHCPLCLFIVPRNVNVVIFTVYKNYVPRVRAFVGRSRNGIAFRAHRHHKKRERLSVAVAFCLAQHKRSVGIPRMIGINLIITRVYNIIVNVYLSSGLTHILRCRKNGRHPFIYSLHSIGVFLSVHRVLKGDP